MLTQELLKKWLNYNPIFGEWSWLLSPANNIPAGTQAGTVRSDGYRRIRILGIPYYSGPLAVLYMTGKWPNVEVDHQNKVRHDDRWVNLRQATESENNSNRGMLSNNTSGYRGVSKVKNSDKWDVRVNRMHIGYYDSAEEAAIIRDQVAAHIQGQFAQLNM